MSDTNKNWLVRRRTGEVLGPFTQVELLESLERGAFTPDDEICPSHGQWMPANTLDGHEPDEFTQTSTRTKTVTETKDSHTKTQKIEEEKVQAPVPDSLTSFNIEEEAPDEERTNEPTTAPSSKPDKENKASKDKKELKAGAAPGVRSKILAATVIFFALWAAIKNFTGPAIEEQPKPKTQNQQVNTAYLVETSPFIEKIYHLIEMGHQKEAFKLLEKYDSSRLHEKEIGYRLPLAALLINKKQGLAKAKSLLNQVLRSPASAISKSRAHQWLGYLALSTNSENLGTNHFLESLALDPKNSASRFNIGRAYLKQKRYKEAIKYFQLAEADLPNSDKWILQIYLGRSKTSLGMYEDARVAFRAAVDMAQDRWLTYIYFSLFLKAMGEKEESQTVLKKMLSRDPHYEMNYPSPFGFFQEAVNYNDYLDSFKEVMKGSDKSLQNLGAKYIKYLKDGPGSKEGKHLLRNIASQGIIHSKVIALKVLLDKNASNSQVKGILKSLPEALDAFGYYAYVLRGEAQLKLGDLKAAQKNFQKALILEPQTAVSRLAYARLLKKAKRLNDAESEINYLLSYHPGYIPALDESQNLP